MGLVYIGKVVSTHGIKGEIRILSDFPFKNKVFVVDKNIIIDGKSYTIKSYRHHKNFEMVTLDDYHDINEVLFLLKKDVYILEEDLKLDDDQVLDEELINYKVISDDGSIGKIKEIFYASNSNKILRVEFEHEVLIPYNKAFVINIDKNKKEIVVKLISGMK